MPGGGGGISQPTARPGFTRTVNQPTAIPSFSRTFSQPTSIPSFSRTWTGISSWTGITSWTGTGSWTFSPTFTWTTTTNYPYPTYEYPYYWIHVGYDYDYNTGSFMLSQALYNSAGGSVCLYYDYFSFAAVAGQTVSARLWTAGWPISYMVVPLSQVPLFQQAGCALSGLGQGQTVNSPYSLYWVAPQNGDFAIILYSPPPYNGPVYLTIG